MGQLLFLGGILIGPVWLIASISRLSSGFPGSTTGPLSPPLSRPARLSSRNPASCFPGPWHGRQLSTRIGRIRDSKNSACWRVIGGEEAPSAERHAADRCQQDRKNEGRVPW